MTSAHGAPPDRPTSSASLTPSHKRSSSYNRGVSFDTFDNRDAQDFALTLNYKHKDYQSTRRSRTFLCGADQNDYSDFALEWLMDELVDDGDEIVCLRVVEKDSKIASDSSIEQGKYIQEAEKLFDQVVAKNTQDEKAISLVMELAVGKVQEIIQRMVSIVYEDTPSPFFYKLLIIICFSRFKSMNRQYSSWAHVVAVLEACKAYYPARYLNTVSNSPPSRSSWFVPLQSEKRRNRND